MIQPSGEALTDFSSDSFGLSPKTITNRVANWFGETKWNGRSILVCIAELALAALSFLSAASFFAAPGAGSLPIETALIFLPLTLVLRGIAIQSFGVCDRSFRHAGIADVIAIAKSVGTSSLALYGISLLVKSRLGASLSGRVFAGDAVILFLILCAFHFGARIYNYTSETPAKTGVAGRRVVIIGAGDAGASVLKDLLDTPRSGITPVALVDDNPAKKGTLICGVPVAGGVAKLSDILFTYQGSEVLICIPSATQQQRQRILATCLKCGVPVRTLPSLNDLLSNRASARDLRAVSIEEALQRERFVPDHSVATNLVGGKVVLVTGAGGSIGSELCRQIAAANPSRLILVDKSENSLFYCHMLLGEAFPDLDIAPFLADVTDSHAIRELFLKEEPEFVFHAAAYKHVGMMERHPEQAIHNNVLGTRNVAMAALEAGVKTFVNVSTDKSVNPRCFMGLSKKLAELLVKETAQRHGVRYMSVRFGNVAGSTGSVLRIFSEQIKKGKPIRITDPHATRYFMSIPEAVSLILCAASIGAGGETFIFNMGTPVNIYELARALTLFAGVVPGEDLPIQFTGLKDGEKVAEELWEDWELPQATENPHVFRLTGSNPLALDILPAVQQLQELLATHDQTGLLEYLDQIVPAFAAQRSGISPAPEVVPEEKFAVMGA
ncbi:MAG TPA: nucleoside-diphosphate sugar epimerase/dehydratase [Candidatus Acidoferrales bacterium]|jgi:FlaA1/EpsC-like NDP-sugar epimerase|nr:nucleoside-diphosphate sugar epimerase/dehydratase [Candidatus Acidoferrales bacterium]